VKRPVLHAVKLLCLAFFTIFFIAACATKQRAEGLNNTVNSAETGVFTGRISLLVQSEPVQSFSGGFDLQGTDLAGELTLTTPLGNTVAVLRWAPGQAQLESWGQTQQFSSVQAMLERTTGAAIPLQALFAWLRGQNATAPGWQPDVSRFAEGRISALRTDPAPPAQLRIVLER
jgi:outer membrane lipoprotein LolB